MKGPRARSIAVLGGGFLGLNVARLLAKAGHSVTLFEASPFPGGVSASFSLGSHTVDRFYHTILPGDTALLGLIEELGLGDAISWRTTRTGFFDGARAHSVSNLLDFLRFPVLSPLERLRLGFAIFRAQRSVRLEEIRGRTCAEWLTKTCGASVYEKLWEPLLRAKLGSAAPEVSASFIWATINRLQDAKSGDQVGNKDRMGFLRGGYVVLLDRLVAQLGEHGVRLCTSSPVTRLESIAPSAPASGEPAWRVTAGRYAEPFDLVVSTLPTEVLRSLAAGGAPGLPRQAMAYLGVVVEVLLLRRTLSPYYILNLADRTLPFTGVIEMTNLAPEGYFGDEAVVYLPRYLAPGDPFARRSDEEVRAVFHEGLRRVFPSLREEDVVASSVQRAPTVQPIHTVDYADRTPPSNVAPGLWIASSAQVHPWPVNNDQILRRAIERAAEIDRWNRSTTASASAQPAA